MGEAHGRWEDLSRYISFNDFQSIAKEYHLAVAKIHVHTKRHSSFMTSVDVPWAGYNTSDRIWTAIGDRTSKEDLVRSGTE